jgi:hypothetical protein
MSHTPTFGAASWLCYAATINPDGSCTIQQIPSKGVPQNAS